MANIKDLAQKTGLSVATVSRVFNDVDKVSLKTRNIVLKAAKELNFRPNKMASALRSGKSKTIGIVVPIIDIHVFSAAIKSMEEVLSAAGYNIIICQSHESYAKECEIIENLKQLRVDGIIISVSKETRNKEHIQSLNGEGVHAVLFDRTLDIDSINSVVINNYNGAYQATKHLIDQGCQKIIHLAGVDTVDIFKERKRGFLAAMTEHGFSLGDADIIEFDDGKPNGVLALRNMLSSDTPPDGIIAHGDISALVAIQILRELKMSIPEDVAIVGFGESSFCPYIYPALSSVSQRNEDVGKLAAEIMLKELKEKDKGAIVYTQQVLPAKLMVRASSLKG